MVCLSCSPKGTQFPDSFPSVKVDTSSPPPSASGEGVNGTLAGSEAGIKAFISFFEGLHPAFAAGGIDWKFSTATAKRLPFPDLSVK